MGLAYSVFLSIGAALLIAAAKQSVLPGLGSATFERWLNQALRIPSASPPSAVDPSRFGQREKRGSFGGIGKAKTPQTGWGLRGFKGEPDDDLLSREMQPTIIGAEAFHCPVRDGKEWFHLAMVVRQRR